MLDGAKISHAFVTDFANGVNFNELEMKDDGLSGHLMEIEMSLVVEGSAVRDFKHDVSRA